MSALVFPRTRCPDCLSDGLGELCPGCAFRLWERVFHYVNPDTGQDEIWPADGVVVIPGVGVFVFEGDGPENGTPRFSGKPAKPFGSGWAWQRWDIDGRVWSRNGFPPGTLLHDESLSMAPVDGRPGDVWVSATEAQGVAAALGFTVSVKEISQSKGGPDTFLARPSQRGDRSRLEVELSSFVRWLNRTRPKSPPE